MRCGGGDGLENYRSTVVLATKVHVVGPSPYIYIVVDIVAFGRIAFPKRFVTYPHHIIAVLSTTERM